MYNNDVMFQKAFGGNPNMTSCMPPAQDLAAMSKQNTAFNPNMNMYGNDFMSNQFLTSA